MTSESQLQLVDESCCEAFEFAWLEGHRREISDCLPPRDSERFLPTLEELICIRMELQWKAYTRGRELTTLVGSETTNPASYGRPTTVEEYAAQFPEAADGNIQTRLIRQEFLIRRRHSDAVDVDSYRQRFPAVDMDALLGAEHLQTSDGLYESGPHPKAGFELPTIAGYELLEELGTGGMGVVYRGRQLAADRMVAIKLIRLDRLAAATDADRNETLERFQTEAQATARLEHPNVVAIYDVDTSNATQPWFSMQLVDGTTLSDVLRQGPLTCRQSAHYCGQLCSAVAAAHRQEILHRDLKPQNVFVRERDGALLVGDFGLAKLARDDAQRTSADAILGTPAYMSPEQIRDASSVDERTDIWSTGAILYRMLAGRAPFQAATVVETLRQVTDHSPVSPRQLNPQIDRDIDTICMKCLQKDPAARYESAEALGEDLQRYLDGRPIIARPVSTPEKVYRWCRRNPLPAGLAALAISGVLAALGGLWTGYRTATAALQESDESHHLARQTVNDLLTEVSETMLFDKPGLQPLRQRLQRKALGYYRRFVATGRDSPDVQTELGDVWYRIARIEQELGNTDAAEDAFRQAISVLSDPHDRSEVSQRLLLSSVYNAFGGFRISQQQWSDADRLLVQALKLRNELWQQNPDDVQTQRLRANTIMNLGAVSRNRGDFEAALRHFKDAEDTHGAILESPTVDGRLQRLIRRDRAKALYNLANTALDADNEDATFLLPEWLDTATAIFQSLCDEDPESYGDHRRLILCRQLKAETTQDPIEAVRESEVAVAEMESLIHRNPAVPQLVAEWKQLKLLSGLLYCDTPHTDRALQSFAEALSKYGPSETRVDSVLIAEAALLKAHLGDESARSDLAEARAAVERQLAVSADDEQLLELRESVEDAWRSFAE